MGWPCTVSGGWLTQALPGRWHGNTTLSPSWRVSVKAIASPALNQRGRIE